MPIQLKRTYDSKDAIPADIYVEKDGKFTLNDIELEGYVPKSTVDEFRTNNTTLKRQLESFDGIDPVKARELLAKEQEIRDAETKGAERIEQRVQERTADRLKAWTTAEEKLKGQVASLTDRLHKAVIESKALELATPFGLRKDAASNLVLTVNSVWTLDEHGEPVAYENDGKTVRLDSAGKSMRGLDGLQRYIEKLAKEDARFLFEPNQGGGAQNQGGGRDDDGEVNPFDPKTLNVTKQGQLINKDFAKAKRMAAKHGIDLKPSSLRANAA